MNTQSSEIYSRIFFSLFVFLIVFTPLAFGATQPWAILVFQLTAFLMALLWLIKIFGEKFIGIRSTWLYLPILLFLALVLSQLLPLPANLIKIFSPNTYEIKYFSQSFFEHRLDFFSLSLYNQGTLQEILKFTACALVFFTAVNEIKSLKLVTILLIIVFVLGFLISVFAIVQQFTWNGKIFWFYDIPINYGVFGPFVNYDHYGGYINMVIMIGFGFLLSEIGTQQKFLVGFMTAIMGASLMLSRSRGAVISLIGGLVFLAMILLIFRRNYEKRTYAMLVASIGTVVILIIALIYWMDWGTVFLRLRTIMHLERNFFSPRLEIWRDSWNLVSRFPLFGVGFGNYQYSFPMVQASHLSKFWRYAHNDFLQLIVETGLLSIVLPFAFIALHFRMIISKIQKSSNNHLAGILTGGTAAVMTMLLHSFVDFNLHITANMFLFSLMTGLTASLAMITKHTVQGGDACVSIKPGTSALISLSGVTFVVALLIIPAVKTYTGQLHYRRAQHFEAANKGQKAVSQEMHAAVRSAPGDASYHHQAGLGYQRMAADSHLSVEERRSALELSNLDLAQAVRLSPSEGKYWASYGWSLLNKHDEQKADQAFQRSLYLSPNIENVKLLYCNYETLRAKAYDFHNAER